MPTPCSLGEGKTTNDYRYFPKFNENPNYEIISALNHGGIAPWR